MAFAGGWRKGGGGGGGGEASEEKAGSQLEKGDLNRRNFKNKDVE